LEFNVLLQHKYGYITDEQKPEIHKIFHFLQRKTKPRPKVRVCRKFGEIWTGGFCDMRADRQTDRHTDVLITILYTLTWG